MCTVGCQVTGRTEVGREESKGDGDREGMEKMKNTECQNRLMKKSLLGCRG